MQEKNELFFFKLCNSLIINKKKFTSKQKMGSQINDYPSKPKNKKLNFRQNAFNYEKNNKRN
jgi:hypothetical protein